MSEEKKRITLKMIAEQSGLSVGTVDRALNHRAGVNEDSKRRVLEVAQQLGYRPNKFASALSRRRAVRIGMLYPDRPEEFYSDIDRGIDHAAGELRDYGVVVEKIRYSQQHPQETRALLAALDPARFDGVAVNAAGALEDADINRFSDAGVPVVTFNTDAPDSRRLFYVGNNSRESGKLGAELLDLLLGGSGNVTVIGNFAQSMPFPERFGGFFEYLQAEKSGLQVFRCAECRGDSALAAETLKDIIRSTPEIHGIFCTDYSSTVGAANALRELARRDIRLVGYDVTALTAAALRERWCDALLYQEPYEQGYQAARLLARRLLENWLPARNKLHLETHVVLKSNLAGYLHRSIHTFDNN